MPNIAGYSLKLQMTKVMSDAPRDSGNLRPTPCAPNMAVTMALTSLLVCSDAQAVQVLRNILQDMGIVVESCGDLRMARARLEDGHSEAVLVVCRNDPAATK